MRTGEEERSRIAEALIELSVDQRYVNTTLEMVQARAGVDERAFERHFADLEDCYCQVYETQRDEFVARIFAAYADADCWREGIRAAGHEMQAFLGEDLRRARFMSVEVLFVGDRAKLIRDEAMQGFFFLIDQGRYEMQDPGSLTPFTAETIGSAIYQRIQTALERDDLEAFETGHQEMMYTIMLPYLGSEAAQEELHAPAPPFLPLAGGEAHRVPE
jgi:AcrR family transcriptional regulator